MAKKQVRLPLAGLRLEPDAFDRLEIDDKAIQTLAALFGWDGEARRILSCSFGGSLHTVESEVAGIENLLSASTPDNFTWDDIPTSEVLLRARVFNSSSIWVNLDSPAGGGVGWLLQPGEWINLPIRNMNRLHVHFIQTANRAELIRTF